MTLVRPTVRRIPMSREEFLRRADIVEEGLRDWEEGVAIQTMVAHGRHNYFVHKLLNQLETRPKLLIRSELFMDLGKRIFGVDVAVLFAEHHDRYQKGRVLGCPDIIVEVLSDDSIYRDRDEKFAAYYKAGVPWYWIGDPVAGTLEEYHASPEGYVRTAMGTLENAFEPKALPGLTIPIAPLLED